MVFCGILLMVGERGIRNLAGGSRNSYSLELDAVGPAVLVAGIFNTLLALKSSPSCSRMATLMILLVNATCTVLPVLLPIMWGSNPLSFSTFSEDDRFHSNWLERKGPVSPLCSFAAYNTFRFIPCSLAFLLPAACTLHLACSLVAVSKQKVNGRSKRLPSPATRNLLLTFAMVMLGILILLTSLIQGKYVADILSALMAVSLLIRLHTYAVTALGLGAMGLGAGQRNPGWVRVVMLVLAGAVFILSYNSFDEINYIKDSSVSYNKYLMDSGCGVQDSYRNRYGAATTTTNSTPTPSNISQACFSVTSIKYQTCLPKYKLCNGMVDITEPANLCKPPNFQSYMGMGLDTHRTYVFIDELFCPELNGIDAATDALRCLLWFQLVLCLFLISALGLGSWKDTQDDAEEEEEELKEGKKTIMDVWKEFQQGLSAKRMKRRPASREG